VNKEKIKAEVLADAKKMLADLVFNMTSHEGNPMTYPQIKTLIDGITVGGHRVSDAEQAKNIEFGWRKLLDIVESGEFVVNKTTILGLHEIYARNEALTWGVFRVRPVLIGGTKYVPPAHTELGLIFDNMVKHYNQSTNRDDASYDLFLTCAAAQFFDDGNKRAGQYLMNGARLSEGLPIITIPMSKNEEYNQKMIYFYETQNRQQMKEFLSECRLVNKLAKTTFSAPSPSMD